MKKRRNKKRKQRRYLSLKDIINPVHGLYQVFADIAVARTMILVIILTMETVGGQIRIILYVHTV